MHYICDLSFAKSKRLALIPYELRGVEFVSLSGFGFLLDKRAQSRPNRDLSIRGDRGCLIDPGIIATNYGSASAGRSAVQIARHVTHQ